MKRAHSFFVCCVNNISAAIMKHPIQKMTPIRHEHLQPRLLYKIKKKKALKRTTPQREKKNLVIHCALQIRLSRYTYKHKYKYI